MIYNFPLSKTYQIPINRIDKLTDNNLVLSSINNEFIICEIGINYLDLQRNPNNAEMYNSLFQYKGYITRFRELKLAYNYAYGLKNLGNTAYLNAGLQCIIHCDYLSEYFLSDSFKHEYDLYFSKYKKTASGFSNAYSNFLKKGVADVASLRSSFVRLKPKFDNKNQNDSPEFIIDFLNELSSNLNLARLYPDVEESLYDTYEDRKWKKYIRKEHSIIQDLFYGMISTNHTCSNCNSSSKSYEVFLSLNLPIVKNDCTLEDCLEKQFFGSAKVAKCSKCGKESKFSCNSTISHAPYYLIVLFKRFKRDKLFIQKNSGLVVYNQFLNIKRFISSPNDNGQYELICVNMHHGSLVSGHYTAECKVKNEWLNFDDTTVNNAKFSAHSSAYLLIYKKCSAPPANVQNNDE